MDELLDHLRVLWLTPAMDGLFTGGSCERRRFLDRLVLSLDPAHGRRATDFERAMRSRNKLLSEGRFDPSWLTGIERADGRASASPWRSRGRRCSAFSRRLIAETREATSFPSAAL